MHTTITSGGICITMVLVIALAGCAGEQRRTDAVSVSDNKTPGTSAVAEKNVAPSPAVAKGFVIKEKVTLSDEAREDFDKAMEYLKAEDYENGIKLLKKVVEHSQGNTAPYINLALAYEKVGNNALAEESLKKALAINPDHPLANNEYALLHRKTGRFAEARAIYEKTLQKYPAFLSARKNLAILCDLYLKDMACALKHYQIYSAAVPNDKSVKIWIADVEKRQ